MKFPPEAASNQTRLKGLLLTSVLGLTPSGLETEMAKSFKVGVEAAQIVCVDTPDTSLVAVGVKISSAIQIELLSKRTLCRFCFPPVDAVKPQ